MKSLIIYSLLLFCVIFVKAQEVTQLKTTTITFEPIGFDVVANLDNYSFIVKENYAGAFSENPINFMKENFDIQSFITYLDGRKSTNL